MAPETAGEFVWAGGSLELRLSTDRTFGWPVQAVKPSQRNGGPLPQDTSQRLAHLTLWYFEPREQPCLQIQYGMDLDRKVINPPGWTGVFRKAADGKSYTLECAIPWSLLGAGDDPPRAGDELGLCWIVNWSDASAGRSSSPSCSPKPGQSDLPMSRTVLQDRLHSRIRENSGRLS